MKRKVTEFLLIMFYVFVSAFFLNFFWESLHGFSLYTDHVIDSDKYVRMMISMSFMDAATILAIYLVCAFFMKDVLWLKALDRKRVIIFFVAALLVAVAAEYWAVYVSYKWHYNDRMPIIFGIGLSPLLQLSVTGLLAMWFTNKLIKN